MKFLKIQILVNDSGKLNLKTGGHKRACNKIKSIQHTHNSKLMVAQEKK